MTGTTLRVAQISDTHIRADENSRLYDISVKQGLNYVLQRLQQQHWPAEFILATGDLVHDEGVAAYQHLSRLLAPLQVPVYCLPGNHDNPAVMAAAYASGQLLYQRHIVAHNWQFIMLNTHVPGSDGGRLAASELELLDSTLAQYSDLYMVVCLHHNPVPVGSAWMDTMMVENSAEFFAIIDRYPQVRAIIWGHIHQEFSQQRNGVQLLGIPSTCAQFKAASAEPEIDRQALPGYRWFEFFTDGRFQSGIERIVRDEQWT